MNQTIINRQKQTVSKQVENIRKMPKQKLVDRANVVVVVVVVVVALNNVNFELM